MTEIRTFKLVLNFAQNKKTPETFQKRIIVLETTFPEIFPFVYFFL